MTIINNIDGVTFEINGIRYQKNFISLVAGDNLRIVDIYDVKLELSPFDNYTNYTVNGNTYTNVADLQKALLPVLFTRASLNGIIVDGDIINIELVGDTLTFILSDGTVVEIDLPYVRSVSGTAVNDTDPRNVIIDKQPNVTTLFSLELSSATLSSDLIDVAVTAINSQSPFTLNNGEQAVFFFDVVDGAIVRRFYFRETTGASTIVTVSDETIIADGDTSFQLSNYQIDLGDIGSQTVEDGFNNNPSEPFVISGQTFIVAIQNSISKIWYWNGGNGEYGNTGSDGQANSNDFILLQDGSSVGNEFLVASNNLSDVDSKSESRNNLDVYSTSETYSQSQVDDLVEFTAYTNVKNVFEDDQEIQGFLEVNNGLGNSSMAVISEDRFTGIRFQDSEGNDTLFYDGDAELFYISQNFRARNIISTGTISGNGVNITNVDAVKLNGLSDSDFVRSTESASQSISLGSGNLSLQSTAEVPFIIQRIGSIGVAIRFVDDNGFNEFKWTEGNGYLLNDDLEVVGTITADNGLVFGTSSEPNAGGLTSNNLEGAILKSFNGNDIKIIPDTGGDILLSGIVSANSSLNTGGNISSSANIGLNGAGGTGDFVSRDGSTGYTGTFESLGGDLVTVKNGIITDIS